MEDAGVTTPLSTEQPLADSIGLYDNITDLNDFGILGFLQSSCWTNRLAKTNDEKTEANRSRLLALWNYKGFFPDGSKAADATVDGSVYDREYIEQ